MTRANFITGHVVNSSMKVHTTLGPGLLESAYHKCLAHELRGRGFAVQSQVEIPIEYEGAIIETAYRIDLLVEGTVIVEVKALAKILPVHEAQLLSYLRLSKKPVGLLINFHELRLRDGIRRIVN
jgi:GxxExxY protein